VRQQRAESGSATLVRLYNLDVIRGALDAQESALQNIKRAETLCEYVLKLLARAKIRECEGLVLLADGSRRFTLVGVDL